MLSADDFILCLNELLSLLVHDDRTVRAAFDKGLAPGPGRGVVRVVFVNLPEKRVQEERGGGAESHNNMSQFFVNGFGTSSSDPVSKVQVEMLVNGIHSGFPSRENRAPNLRKKSGPPEKVAAYLAAYINDVAASFAPQFTHE
jgi:hypothetical protein